MYGDWRVNKMVKITSESWAEKDDRMFTSTMLWELLCVLAAAFSTRSIASG
jgi:hypothetical protein